LQNDANCIDAHSIGFDLHNRRRQGIVRSWSFHGPGFELCWHLSQSIQRDRGADRAVAQGAGINRRFVELAPTSYNDYFAAQATLGRASAADVYASLNRYSGKRFEGVAEDLDSKALGAAAAIRRHYKAHGEARPDIMLEICDRAGKNLREALGKASSLAEPNSGTASATVLRRSFRIS